MKFRTEIKLESQQENQIDYQSKVLLLGSCFSENIGQKLSYYKFNTLINPFGVIFNPVSLAQLLDDTIHQNKYTKENLVESYDLFHSLFHHSDLSALSADEVLGNIHKAQKACFSFLQHTTHVIITLGTAWVYEYNQTKEVVANCHKISQKQFTKRLLTLDEIKEALCKIENLVSRINPKTQLIYTVSPVRHIKDGIEENGLSKASLRLAVQSTKYKVQSDNFNTLYSVLNTSYFPSYEILLGDLRDYRFYEADLIHPNQVAIDYIWEQFSKTWITEKAQTYFKQVQSVQRSLLHKPFNPDSEQHQQFLNKLQIKINQLEKELGITF